MDGTPRLSRREREVAELVADGLTNREIAERLVISERTAEGHVEQIRNKLGLRSRAQVAAWVAASRQAPTSSAPTAPPSVALAMPSGAPPLVDASQRTAMARWSRMRSVRALVLVLVLVIVTVAVIALRPAHSPAGTLTVVAGLGSDGFSGDGGPATAAQLSRPTSIVIDPSGAIVFADSRTTVARGVIEDQTALRRVDRDGTVTTIGGLGTSAPSDGSIVTAVHLPPDAIIAGAAGAIFVAFGYQAGADTLTLGSSTGHGVARIGNDGSFRVIAGGAVAGYSGDGGPAMQAQLRFPRGVTVAADGRVYVADSGNDRIREISPDGTIATVAGSGERGSTGDGGRATAARFFAPLAVTLSSDGALVIADTNNNSIRAIDHGGHIVAVAGDGAEGFSGDGGPATAARLSLPSGLAYGPDGVLYIADTGNARVRAVRRDGSIVTVAGPPDLVSPTAVAVGPDGTLYIGDAGAHRIFRLTLP